MKKTGIISAAIFMIAAALIIRICDIKNRNAAYPVSSAGGGGYEMHGVTLRDAANSIFFRAVTKIDS